MSACLSAGSIQKVLTNIYWPHTMNQECVRKTVKRTKELWEFIQNHTLVYMCKYIFTHTYVHPEIAV